MTSRKQKITQIKKTTQLLADEKQSVTNLVRLLVQQNPEKTAIVVKRWIDGK
ncbi:hypothetical protein [Flocculibacter collagenilyticus]|uniref:hypothetical protein n=1 Tax=Flocculibacter collagenilyticus TaxID=2744479 RepID=UPI0018F67601|nr:hypothetical protein [Flocculibacter collagenilyticus]